MGRSAGTYTPPASSWNPAVNLASATFGDWNALLTDISNALTQSIAVDGQSVVTANIPFYGFKLTGVGNGTATGDAINLGQLQDTVGATAAAFSANTSATRTTTGVFTTYADVDFNDGSYFDASTGLFTAPYNGYYQFNCIVRGTNTATGAFSGGIDSTGFGSPATSPEAGGVTGATTASVTTGIIIKLAATNTVSVRLWSITNVAWAPRATHFSGCLIRRY